MICSNIGRKSDKIITKRKSLYRRWLFKRFRVRLRHPRKGKDFCHALRYHGPQFNIVEQFQRTLGQSDLRMPKSNFASRFYSHEVMEQARTQFLIENERAMQEHARKIEQGVLDPTDYFASKIRSDVPLGEGLVRMKQDKKPMDQTGGVKHFGNVRTATLVYAYDEGCWYEITAYPDVKDDLEQLGKSGPTIYKSENES